MAVKLPADYKALQAAGWTFQFSRQCRLCNRSLEFWRTKEKKFMPLESITVEGKWLLASHWATCPRADRFRKGKMDTEGGERQRSLFT